MVVDQEGRAVGEASWTQARTDQSLSVPSARSHEVYNRGAMRFTIESSYDPPTLSNRKVCN